jgi:hypothetical protein
LQVGPDVDCTVKIASPEALPVPQALMARIRVKYMPGARLPICVLVPVTVLTVTLLAPAAVPTSTRYWLTPAIGAQESVTVLPDTEVEGEPGVPGGGHTIVSC